MPEPSSQRILVVDVGGTRVKLLATGQTLKRTMDSGPRLTPRAMVAGVKKQTADWKYDAVSLGLPAPVRLQNLTLEEAAQDKSGGFISHRSP